MNIAELVDGITDKSTGDYYIGGRMIFVWRGRVVGWLMDPVVPTFRRELSSRWWGRFLFSQKSIESANTADNKPSAAQS